MIWAWESESPTGVETMTSWRPGVHSIHWTSRTYAGHLIRFIQYVHVSYVWSYSCTIQHLANSYIIMIYLWQADQHVVPNNVAACWVKTILHLVGPLQGGTEINLEHFSCWNSPIGCWRNNKLFDQRKVKIIFAW